MLLSNNDIEKIKNLGYDRNYFVVNKKGWLILKNKEDRCIFNNGKKCLIYDNRPEGCILYPLIYNIEKKSAVLDEECPHSESFKFNKNKVDQLSKLVKRIFLERKKSI